MNLPDPSQIKIAFCIETETRVAEPDAGPNDEVRAAGPLAVWSRPSSAQLGSPGMNEQYPGESRFSLLRKRLGKPAPTPGTKPYTRHILGIDSGLQSHPNATPKPPQSHILGIYLGVQSHLKATPMRPSCDPKATSKPPQSANKATPEQRMSLADSNLLPSEPMAVFGSWNPRKSAAAGDADEAVGPFHDKGFQAHALTTALARSRGDYSLGLRV
jgi:hypothetical protein